MSNSHLVFSNQVLCCLYCGDKYRLKLPLDIKTFGQKTKAFIKLHEDCEKPNSDSKLHSGYQPKEFDGSPLPPPRKP